MLNKKEDILKNAGNQLMVPIDFHSISFPAMEVNGDQQLFGSSKFFKISSFVFNIRKNLYRFGTTWGWVYYDTIHLKIHVYRLESYDYINCRIKILEIAVHNAYCVNPTFCGYVQLIETLEFHSAVTVQFSANIWPCNVWTKPVLFKYTSRILFTVR